MFNLRLFQTEDQIHLISDALQLRFVAAPDFGRTPAVEVDFLQSLSHIA